MLNSLIRFVVRRPELYILGAISTVLAGAVSASIVQLHLATRLYDIGRSHLLKAPFPLDSVQGMSNQLTLSLGDSILISTKVTIWLTGTLALLLLLSITHLVLRFRNLRETANYDPLTRLANRGRFQQVLSALACDPGAGNDLALMLIDIDYFKSINDTHGHDAGDAVLKELARRLEELPPGRRWIARLGGDEFALLVVANHIFGHSRHIAEALCRLMDAPFALDGRQVNVSVSVGISYMAQGAYTPEGLLKNADIALYSAKMAGRGTFRFFDPKLDAELKARLALECDLREAIHQNRLELHFQPLVDLQSQQTAAYEALARWNHPKLGAVPPQHFIKVAEEIGEMRILGSWIIRQACHTARSWPDGIGVAINLSPQQFEGDDLLPLVEGVIRETGIDPFRIEFEITESLLISDKERVAGILQALKALGVRIALDDFGTGYSSMSYLHRFPIDKIKIDRSFVADMAHKPEAAAIIETISLLARRLGLTTTAEGIETEAQAIFLRSIGCDEGQGYYFAKPLPAETCCEWLGRRAAGSACSMPNVA